jgi:hypothetical protein
MRTTIAVLLLSVSLTAQVSSELLTHGGLNGRFWKTMTSEQQDFFVLGYRQAFNFYVTAKDQGKFPAKSTPREIAEGLSEIYSAPENIALPIDAAIMIYERKAAGWTREKIEDLLAKFREASLKPETPAKN